MSASNFSGTGANSYDKYQQDHRYEYDNGLVVMPVASRTAAHKVVRLHGGVGIRRVSFDTVRRGKPPVIPTMADTNWDTFVGGTVTAMTPIPNFQTGGFNWHVSGEYLYVQTEPRVVGQNTIPTGGYPFPVAPNDALATSYASGAAGAAFANAADGTNANEAAAEAVGNDIVDHDNERYVWPFTMMPTIFSNDQLIGS